ncbi:MAG: hypothetical protein AB7G76_07250 [Steroidobacteraceae bacterium]
MRHWLIVFLAATTLGACRSMGGGCGAPPEYTNSDSIPPLEVPPGMDLPNTRGALRIPELDTPERPRGPDEPCLDQPPKYVPPAKPAPQPQA